jgi:hypothetical protein
LPYAGGQFFNLFNFGKTEQAMKTLKLKEIKNGRLAMLAMFGYGAQVRGDAGMLYRVLVSCKADMPLCAVLPCCLSVCSRADGDDAWFGCTPLFLC